MFYRKLYKILLFILILVILINSFIRVSDKSSSIGFIEYSLFGKSIFAFLRPAYSENYKKWESATNGSTKIADTLSKYGKDLIDNPDLDEIRIETSNIAKSSYLSSRELELDYLEKSNKDLPFWFNNNLLPALKLWSEGLDEKNPEKIYEGIKLYNEFLKWMQSNTKDDFKPLR